MRSTTKRGGYYSSSQKRFAVAAIFFVCFVVYSNWRASGPPPPTPPAPRSPSASPPVAGSRLGATNDVTYDETADTADGSLRDELRRGEMPYPHAARPAGAGARRRAAVDEPSVDAHSRLIDGRLSDAVEGSPACAVPPHHVGLRILFYCQSTDPNVASSRHYCVDLPDELSRSNEVQVQVYSRPASLLQRIDELRDACPGEAVWTAGCRGVFTIVLLFIHDGQLLSDVKSRSLGAGRTLASTADASRAVTVGLIRCARGVEYLRAKRVHLAVDRPFSALDGYDLFLPDSWSLRQALLHAAPAVASVVVHNVERVDRLRSATGAPLELPRRPAGAAGSAAAEVEAYVHALSSLVQATGVAGPLLGGVPRMFARAFGRAPLDMPAVRGAFGARGRPVDALVAEYRVCIHGFHDTLMRLEDMQRALNVLGELVPFALVVVGDALPAALAASPDAPFNRTYRLEFHAFSTLAAAYATLATCDVGLVPHVYVDAVPWRAADVHRDGAGRQRGAEWSSAAKVNANGGRAFVFAQLGVPFVATPEVETVALAAEAWGAAVARRLTVYTAQGWLDALLFVLDGLSAARYWELAAAVQSVAAATLRMSTDATALLDTMRELYGIRCGT